jgi:RHS repeat-associated protein
VKPDLIHRILVGLILVGSMMFAPLASLGQSVTGTSESASSRLTVGTAAGSMTMAAAQGTLANQLANPGAPVQAVSSPAPLYSFILGYGPNANIITAQDSLNGNWSYSYDEFNRLLTASGDVQGQSFDYDAYGNRWHENATRGQVPSAQFVFDNSNRVVGSGVQYDALGNVINDGVHRYTYDAENRLVKVDLNPDGSSAASYTYDAFGRRVSKTAAGAATEFLYDLAGRVIAERDSTTGAWNRSEVYAGGRHLATYARNTTYFRHSDWLGSSRVKTLPDGTVAETCTSLPFGDGLTCTPGAGQSASPDLFAGYERDQETQLDHTLFRKYSSAQGRWTTPDPYLGSIDLANPQSLNRYAYVLNNPVNLRDPLGLGDCVYYADDGNQIEEIDSESNEGECRGNGGEWFANGFPTDGSITVVGNFPVVPFVPEGPSYNIWTPIPLLMYAHPIGPQKATAPAPCRIPQGLSRQTPFVLPTIAQQIALAGHRETTMSAAPPSGPSMRAATRDEILFPWPANASASCIQTCLALTHGQLMACPSFCSGERPEFERESPHIEENRVPFQVEVERQNNRFDYVFTCAPTSGGD